MRKLSTADVLEATGLTPKAFQIWREAGAATPAEGGQGHGNHARYSVMQTLGIAVAARLRSSDRGCAMSYVRSVVEAFGGMKEEKLLEAFKNKKTHLASICQGKPILDGKSYDDWVDVQRTYLDVTRAIAKIEHRFRHFVGGRGRGLAGVKS